MSTAEGTPDDKDEKAVNQSKWGLKRPVDKNIFESCL